MNLHRFKSIYDVGKINTIEPIDPSKIERWETTIKGQEGEKKENFCFWKIEVLEASDDENKSNKTIIIAYTDPRWEYFNPKTGVFQKKEFSWKKPNTWVWGIKVKLGGQKMAPSCSAVLQDEVIEL